MKKIVFALGLVAALSVQPQAAEAQSQCLLGACWSGGQFGGGSAFSGEWNRDLRDWLNRFDGWDGSALDWDRIRDWTVGPIVIPVRPRPEVGVMEPGTLFLLLAGTLGLAFVGWSRREELLD